MAKLRISSNKKKACSIVKLKIAVGKLQKMSLLLGRKSSLCCDESAYVPKDVKEGHFAVIAEDGEEPKRFVVPLSFLTHPVFLRLLEQAAEEYGFDQEGTLTIPCRPCALEKILAEQCQEEEDSESGTEVSWDSCKALIQSY